MLDEILTNKEQTKSILITDNFENEAFALLISIIKKFSQSYKSQIRVYPASFKATQLLRSHQFDTKVDIDDIFVKSLFVRENDETGENCLQCVLKKATADSEQQKSILVFDNLNLLLRHFGEEPFQILHFVIECAKRPDVSSIVMLVHEDTLDEPVLNQLKAIFQTVLNPRIHNESLKTITFNVDIVHKNAKTFKTTLHEETVHINMNDFTVEKVEKNIMKIKQMKNKDKEGEDDNDDAANDLFKKLSFNVYQNPDDMEAKKNLVLPYEIIGKQQQVKPQATPQQDEEAKIYYAPDERDDVDDDDPDDDLNF